MQEMLVVRENMQQRHVVIQILYFRALFREMDHCLSWYNHYPPYLWQNMQVIVIAEITATLKVFSKNYMTNYRTLRCSNKANMKDRKIGKRYH